MGARFGDQDWAGVNGAAWRVCASRATDRQQVGFGLGYVLVRRDSRRIHFLGKLPRGLGRPSDPNSCFRVELSRWEERTARAV